MSGLKTDRLVAAVAVLLGKIGICYSLDRRRGVVVFQVTPPGEGLETLLDPLRKLGDLAVELE